MDQTSMSMAFCYRTLHKTDKPQHKRRIEDYYDRLNDISDGSYGAVYRMRDKSTGEVVAVKHEFNGSCEETIREIDILASLPRHPSIVEFKRVFKDDYGRVFVVMEYIENDLRRFLKVRAEPFAVSEVKSMMKRILEGVKFLHDNGIMHRDLKPGNILINSDRSQVKICDFGLSRRMMSDPGCYSPDVVTLWYRAPELLMDVDSYCSAIDMWSVGCIMAELLSNKVLFRGTSEIHQLRCIYRIIGKPDEPADVIRKKFAAILTASGCDLLERLLELNPDKRITAEDALNHSWFGES